MEGVGSQATTPPLTTHRRSLLALTVIRFFAAFYVVIFHSRVGGSLFERGHYAAAYFFMSGYLAVPLFFLLSGFILAYTYEGQMEQRGDFRRFWEARFARIWPVYAISLLLSSVPGLVFPPLGVAVATLCMVQAWNPFNAGMAGAWNFVCWTLSVKRCSICASLGYKAGWKGALYGFSFWSSGSRSWSVWHSTRDRGR